MIKSKKVEEKIQNWKFNWKKSKHSKKRHKIVNLDEKELQTSEKSDKKLLTSKNSDKLVYKIHKLVKKSHRNTNLVIW